MRMHACACVSLTCMCVFVYTREEFIISSEEYRDSFVAFNVSRTQQRFVSRENYEPRFYLRAAINMSRRTRKPEILYRNSPTHPVRYGRLSSAAFSSLLSNISRIKSHVLRITTLASTLSVSALKFGARY